MAVQLPEPDYYTLAEVAERWEKDIVILLRLAREGKITLGFKTPSPFFPLGICGTYRDEETGAEESVLLDASTVSGSGVFLPDPERNFLQIAPEKLLLYPASIPNHDSLKSLLGSTFNPLYMAPWPPDKLPDGWFFVPYEDEWVKQALGSKDESLAAFLDRMPFSEGSNAITSGDIIVPTSEIHRMEHQHENAEQAAADDVLGTKDKERLQGMIAAMAQIIASKAPAYKNGDKPNAAQIADAIVNTGMVDREPETIAKEIGKVLREHKKRHHGE